MKPKSIIIKCEAHPRYITWEFHDISNATNIHTMFEAAGIEPTGGRKYRVTIRKIPFRNR
jgi:hypothetical protein